MNKRHFIKTYLLLILSLTIKIALSDSISGYIYARYGDNKFAISGVKVLEINSINGCYTNKSGIFYIKKEGEFNRKDLAIFKNDYIIQYLPSKNKFNEKIDLEPISRYQDFVINIQNSEDKLISDSVKIFGQIFDANADKIIAGAIIYLSSTPHFRVSDENGKFSFNLSIFELSTLNAKELWIIVEKNGYETESILIKRNDLIIKHDFNLSKIKLKKYIPSHEYDSLKIRLDNLRDSLEKYKNNDIVHGTDSNSMKNYINSIFSSRYSNQEIDKYMQKTEDTIKSLNQRIDKEIEAFKSNYINLETYLKEYEEFDSTIKYQDSTMVQKINLTNKRIDTIVNIATLLYQDIDKVAVAIPYLLNQNLLYQARIDTFNVYYNHLYNSYLKRSRQNDLFTSVVVSYFLPIANYPDTTKGIFLSVSTNFNSFKLRELGLYFDFEYAVLFGKEVNTIENSPLFAGLSLRPPVDIINNLKLDIGVGMTYGYDFNNAKDKNFGHFIQPYLKGTIQYKVYQKWFLYSSFMDRLVFDESGFGYGLSSFNIGLRYIVGKSSSTKKNSSIEN